MKLKLTLQPADAEADLNEEDRRMIEEIKRMQLLSARIAGNVKVRRNQGKPGGRFRKHCRVRTELQALACGQASYNC